MSQKGQQTVNTEVRSCLEEVASGIPIPTCPGTWDRMTESHFQAIDILRSRPASGTDAAEGGGAVFKPLMAKRRF